MIAIVDTLRARTDLSISLNPFTIDGTNAETLSATVNSYGATRAGAPVAYTGSITVQVIKSNSVIPQKEGELTPVKLQESYYLIAKYSDTIPENLRFNYVNGKRFTTMKPEKVINGGAHVYTRVPLEELK